MKNIRLALWFLALLLSTSIVFATDYSNEEIAAYEYAYINDITTQDSIEAADMGWWLIRIAMAKMISNYAINILGLTPDTSKSCSFPDVSRDLDEQYDNWVKTACQLGLMWVWMDRFYPYWKVTRAEFGTVLSRALNSKNKEGLKTLNDWDPYFQRHLEYLRDEWIMIQISDPYIFEIRGRVMIMLMRAADTWCTSDEFNWILTKCNIDSSDWYPCYQDGEDSLYCRHVVSIKSWAFENYPNLKKLTILGWGWAASYNILGGLKGITNLTSLEELNLPHNNLSDLSPISWMTNLVKLNLDNNHISDISFLKGLKKLEELSLDFNYVSDISVLKYLTWLKVLSIDQSYWDKNISNISVLKNLRDLEKLGLSDQNISDISILKNNTKLDTLYLSHNNISDISPLKNLKNLTLLSLWQNNISNISILSNLKNLQVLTLDVNNITDISALAWLINLNHLALNNNNITDISALSNLINLSNLYLWENNISDISPLKNLPKLFQLYIWKNPINYGKYQWLQDIPDVSVEF